MVWHRSRSGESYGGAIHLKDLDLSVEQFAVIAVSEAKTAIAAIEELGHDPGDGLRRLAAGDPDLIAAFVAENSTIEATDVA